jgi:phosphotransferase system  glucose/maltose/N-acetylglucosamine-specific IIC component
VTITGTQVVPEFPIAMLGIVAAVIAVITVAGRTRLVKGKF